MFINQGIIEILLYEAKYSTDCDIEKVFLKACKKEKLSYKDIATLLQIEDEKHLDKLFKIAGRVNTHHVGPIDVDLRTTATTTDNYRNLKEEGICTYMLFQETYHLETYLKNYGKSITDDYYYHIAAFDRAIEAGLEDVGTGVLLGLANPKFEVLALTMHNEHIENKYGIGFSNILFPRLKITEHMTSEEYPNIVNDTAFKKIIAITRLSLPLINLIMSTRETNQLKNDFLECGGSQVSADF